MANWLDKGGNPEVTTTNTGEVRTSRWYWNGKNYPSRAAMMAAKSGGDNTTTTTSSTSTSSGTPLNDFQLGMEYSTNPVTNYSGAGNTDSGWANSLADMQINNLQSGYELEAYGPQGKNAFYSNKNPWGGASTPEGGGGGLGKWFTPENMEAFGSAASGLGSLASGWAAIKNLGLARQAAEDQRNQWNKNYESQRTAVNNQIANQNAWKQAQGRTDFGSYVGGKPTDTNYVG